MFHRDRRARWSVASDMRPALRPPVARNLPHFNHGHNPPRVFVSRKGSPALDEHESAFALKESSHASPRLQGPVSLHWQLRSLDPRRGHPQPCRPKPFPGPLGGLDAQGGVHPMTLENVESGMTKSSDVA